LKVQPTTTLKRWSVSSALLTLAIKQHASMSKNKVDETDTAKPDVTKITDFAK